LSESEGEAVRLLAVPDTFVTRGRAVSNDPSVFADKLRRIDNEHEVMIVFRDATAPPQDPDFIASIVDDSTSAVAPSFEVGSVAGRSVGGFAPASAEARDRLLGYLADRGIEPYRATGSVFPIIYVRLPDSDLEGLVTDLLRHPNLDYVEANQRRAIFADAAPVGVNPSDIKHDFHNVLSAWDSTRGEGAKVGVMDSGVASTSFDPATVHVDAQDFSTSGYGVVPMGFVDDYGVNCFQPAGNCPFRDDFFHTDGTHQSRAHGTGAVGLVGANDNDLGFVGVMPFGITYSLKVTFDEDNALVTGTCDVGNPDFCLEDEDLTAAVDWAADNDLDVLSMSWSASGLGACVFNAMNDAYNVHDILLLAATGNDPNQALPEPKKWEFVMGVGGINEDGSNAGNDEYEEVSGLWGGWTLEASCPADDFCDPAGYREFGGTSAATANVAGIAGLIRSIYPSWDAGQIRSQLRKTAKGVHSRVDALDAILLIGTIDGPTQVPPQTTCQYVAQVTGGNGPFTYEWRKGSSVVGTGASVFINTGDSSFTLSLDVQDADGRTSHDHIFVSIEQFSEPPECFE